MSSNGRNGIAVHVESLSKRYHIGARRDPYMTLRDKIVDSLAAPVRRAKKLLRGQATGAAELDETIWALKNVSFEVQQGEVLGIIGRNGAGKSTLLKILSRITEPTEGFAEIYGRISSLLEVGTGFHPELTGQENVYLNGAILGMKRAEIDRKFDEIVAFSEVEKFINTPVKHYSTGMHVRLAFSVAAHLEPEILVIDEVLSVGDAAFQKKCLGKMGNVAQAGRTVLFVSHNMGAVDNLCTRVLWLDEGRIVADGEAGHVLGLYLQSTLGPDSARFVSENDRSAAHGVRITEGRLLNDEAELCETFRMGDTIAVEFDVEFEQAFRRLDFSLEILRMDMGTNVVHCTNEDCGLLVQQVRPGRRRVRVEIPNCLLYPGDYRISFWIGEIRRWNVWAAVDNVLPFSIVQSSITKRTQRLSVHKEAIVFLPTRWSLS